MLTASYGFIHPRAPQGCETEFSSTLSNLRGDCWHSLPSFLSLLIRVLLPITAQAQKQSHIDIHPAPFNTLA